MDKIDNNYSYDYSILCELCEYCPYKSFGCRPSYYVSINGNQISWDGVFCDCEDWENWEEMRRIYDY